MPELISIFTDLEGQPQAALESEHLRLRGKHRLPERGHAASWSDVTIWWDPVAVPTSTRPNSYYSLGQVNSVIVPAGNPEPDVLSRFAGIMSEVFRGPPLRSEEIDRALRRIRGRE